MDRRTMARLAAALNAKKDRDAGLLAAVRRDIAMLDAEADRIKRTLEETARSLEPGDLVAAAALDRQRRTAAGRLRRLAQEKAVLEAVAAERRAALARSNGEAVAAETLASRSPPPRRR